MPDLTREDFLARARTLDIDPELHEQLYSMVRDLLRMAARVRSLTPELHADIALEDLSHDARGNA